MPDKTNRSCYPNALFHRQPPNNVLRDLNSMQTVTDNNCLGINNFVMNN
jgi:hypothetical protein